MTTAEEAEQERAVFEDDDDSSESDDSEDDEDDGAVHAAPPQALTAEPILVPVTAGDLNPSAPSHGTANPNPNPSSPNHVVDATPSDAAAAHPQNGAIPVQILPLSAAAPSDPSLFTSPSSALVSVSAGSGNEDRRSGAVVSLDDSRRLFQRLWTDEEEIRILHGFFEFTSKRGTTFASHQYDTGPFYEEIKKQLQFDFTKNQLIEKLRRLKKKYRNCVGRMQAVGKDFAFKSAHERAIYDIARKIWSASAKRAHESDDEDLNTPNTVMPNEIITVPINDGSLSSERRSSRSRRRMRRRMMEEDVSVDPTAAVGGVAMENSTPVVHTPLASAPGIPNIVEETVKSCLSPLFKELINSCIGGPLGPAPGSGTLPFSLLPLSLGGGSLTAPGMPVDEKWRKQQILELEVYLKRLELVKDHIKSTLEQLKSSGS